MTPSARIQSTIDLLMSMETVDRPADAIISGYFRARRYMGSKDRAAVSKLVYGVLRHHARIHWWLEKCEADTSPRAQLISYLLLIEKQKASTLPEIFSGKKFAPAELNEDEEKLVGRLSGHTAEHPEMPDMVKAECPDWAHESLAKRFGDSFARELSALLAPAPLDLRINPLKTSREEAMETLIKNGIHAEPCKISPWGIRVLERPDLNRVTLLRDGAVEIQDEGSQLVALLVNAKPGQRVVDFCAGAGGKTLAISATMKNKGHIIACDVLANRLKRSSERFRRAGLHNIETKAISSESDPWVKKHKGSFDRVLVDAPCSGTGTWRRNPDSRWRNLGPDLDALIHLQERILSSASRLVKPGGRLIYATCSLLPEENEEQIEKFLASHSDFKVIPVNNIESSPIAARNNSPYMLLTPATDGTDGFFTAVMEKTYNTSE